MTTYNPTQRPLKSYVRFYNEKYYVLCEPCAFKIFSEGGFVGRGTLKVVDTRICQKCGHSLLRTRPV